MLHMIFFSLILGLFHGPEDTLITIYDKDCGYCQVLLESTYKNDDVSDVLSKYNHQLFEASEGESKKMIKEFGITSFPTQIRITKAKDTLLLEGYVNVEQQLRFLEGKTNTGKAVKELSNTAGGIKEKVAGQSSELSEIGKKFICIFVKNESFEDFMAKAEKMVKREGIKFENIQKYISDVSNDIICENKLSVHMRKKTSLFKYALDTLNYEFIEGLIDHDKNGECNPNIDYAQKETLEDGTEEELMGFLDKIIDAYDKGEEGMRVVHDISALKRVKGWLKSCHERDKDK